MIERFERSWELIQVSFSILKKHKVLLVFPAISFVCILGMVMFFASAVIMQPTGYQLTQKEHWQKLEQQFLEKDSTTASSPENGNQKKHVTLSRSGLIVAAIFYFVCMFVATFLNVAFYNQIFEALSDRPVSIGDGLQFALSKLPSIFTWTIFAGLVGYLIRVLEERFSLFGKVMMSLLGVAWSVASVFAIPVIVRKQDSINPFSVLQESARTLKKTWGESLIGYVGLSAGLFFFALILSMIGTVMLISLVRSPILFISTIIVWSIVLFVASYVLNVMGDIYRCSLYIYSTLGRTPGAFTPEMLDGAWKFKQD